MTFVEYEKFLTELDANGEHKVLLIDFLSLSGSPGYDGRVEQRFKDQALDKFIFRLAVPFNIQCQFVQKYKVAKPCTLVAVSAKDSAKAITFCNLEG